jgi:hypothetical protein
MQDEPKEGGVWAERYVQDFLSLPFVSEFVFHNPQTLDGTQKEVADLLIAYSVPWSIRWAENLLRASFAPWLQVRPTCHLFLTDGLTTKINGYG